MIKIRKKLIASATVLTLFLLTGCNSAKEPVKPDVASSKPTPTENTIENNINATAPERIDGTITLKLGYSTNSSDPRGVASEQFKQDVESKTNGTVRVDIYSDGQRGSDSELITGIINGTIDMTVSSAGNFTGYCKNVGMSALPFLFSSFDEAWKFMDSDMVNNINKDLLEYNIRVLAHFDNGFRCVTTKDKAINSPENMAGLNIRTSDNAVVKETMSALGANPQTLAFSELYQALANGTFDAQENPIPVIYNSKLYEVQSCLSITNHSYDAMPFVISNAAWNMLSTDEQHIIQEAAIAAQKTDRDMVKNQSGEYVDKLEKECGMTITRPDLTAFKEKTKDVATYFSYDKALLDQVNSIIK